jgi:phosphohistidine swiveling domain-containing protein
VNEEAPEFPIVWEDPADAEVSWQYDPVHLPSAVAPLEFELGLGPFLEGFGWGMKPRQFNYYIYYQLTGPPSAGAERKPDVAEIRDGGRRWREKVLPEVLEHTERYRTADFASMTNEQLIEEIDKLPELRHRSGRLHTMAITPHWQGMSLLVDTYRELTGGDDLAAVRLVQGYGDKSFEAGERLWRVGRVAAAIPLVRERLATIDRETANSALESLRTEASAAPFVEAFDAYIEAYGWRGGGGFSGLTWCEDPTVPLTILRSHLETDGYDPNVEQRRLVGEREAAIRETMAALDEDGRRRLADVIDAAREVAYLSEDHNFYIDQRLWNMPRRLVMVAAERLASTGALAQPGDVFFLRHAELRDALRGEGEGLAATAVRRKEELAHWKTVRPPPYIGAASPAVAVEQERPLRIESNGELRGTGASAGIARGPVRVITSLAEADRLRPGDVLVTRVTQPAWTPLFSIARAVVTEVGGVLSHTAVAAREYGIPAVASLPDATRLLRDGQLVEVDGSSGVVRVIS